MYLQYNFNHLWACPKLTITKNEIEQLILCIVTCRVSFITIIYTLDCSTPINRRLHNHHHSPTHVYLMTNNRKASMMRSGASFDDHHASIKITVFSILPSTVLWLLRITQCVVSTCAWWLERTCRKTRFLWCV